MWLPYFENYRTITSKIYQLPAYNLLINAINKDISLFKKKKNQKTGEVDKTKQNKNKDIPLNSLSLAKHHLANFFNILISYLGIYFSQSPLRLQLNVYCEEKKRCIVALVVLSCVLILSS